MAMTNVATAEVPVEVSDLLTWLRVEKGRSVNTLSAYRLDLKAYVAWLAERRLRRWTAQCDLGLREERALE